MAEIDIEKMLGEDEEPDASEKGVKTEEAAGQGSPADKKADATEEDAEVVKLRKENERLKKANKTLNDEKKAKAEAKAPKEETVDTEDPLATREGWLGEIDRRAKEAVKPIYESNFRKAMSRFAAAHPEYSSNKEDLRVILEAAKASGAVDEDDIFEAMGRAWGSLNWRKLEADSAKKDAARSRARTATMTGASPSESSGRQEDDFSEEEREEAARFGKSPEAYRKAKRLLEETSITFQ